MGIVKSIVTVPEPGETYEGKVKGITEFGAFVEFLPGKEGLLHISEISWKRLPSMEGVLQVGEEIKVKLVEVDKRSGKYRLSRKALLPRPEGMPEEEERPRNRERNDRGDRGDRGGDRGGRGGERRPFNRDRDNNRDRGPREHRNEGEAPRNNNEEKPENSNPAPDTTAAE